MIGRPGPGTFPEAVTRRLRGLLICLGPDPNLWLPHYHPILAEMALRGALRRAVVDHPLGLAMAEALLQSERLSPALPTSHHPHSPPQASWARWASPAAQVASLLADPTWRLELGALLLGAPRTSWSRPDKTRPRDAFRLYRATVARLEDWRGRRRGAGAEPLGALPPFPDGEGWLFVLPGRTDLHPAVANPGAAGRAGEALRRILGRAGPRIVVQPRGYRAFDDFLREFGLIWECEEGGHALWLRKS